MDNLVFVEISIPEEYVDRLVHVLRNFNSVNSDEVSKAPVKVERVYKKEAPAIIPRKV